MLKVLFVCHGNICRSPMAEMIFKELLRRNDLEDEFSAESAGTSDEEVWRGRGNPVYPLARRELEEHDIPCEDHFARQMTRSDYDRFDLLVGMEEKNIWDMRWISGGDPQGKMRLMLDYTDRRGDVADPWYTRNFNASWRDICDGCVGILKFYTDRPLLWRP